MSKMLLEFLVASLLMLIVGVIYFMVFDNFMNLHQTNAAQIFRKRAREKAPLRRDLAPGAGVLGAQPGSFRARSGR